ncbi:alginate export family protein [Rariglobus hedericola]|nr:alginate export family protein [Rariglobus hedericola]
MKSHLLHIALLASIGASALIADPAPAPASFTESLTHGKVSINARLRYETVDQDGFADADALTARLRLGYTTKAYKGFQAMIEGEAVTPIVKDYFDSTGTNGSNYAAVADPEVYHVNQAWLAYTYEKTKGTLGRQKLILDNARFIGDVGWRQNDQTFDAFVVQDKSFEKTTLTYAYLERINRIFDDSGAQPDWDSNSHVFNASYAGFPIGTLTAYAYLLDFDADSAPAVKTAVRNNSNATYGLSLAGTRPFNKDWKASYRLEYATQSDYGNSALGYNADYYVAELGGAYKTYTLTAGYEVLGSDNGLVGFKAPLATMHAFNGWADAFLATPAGGLTDTYLKAGAKAPGPVQLLAGYHFFGTEDAATTLAQEFDALAVYKLNKQLSFTAKFAKFWSDQTGAATADRTKFWLQADYAY